MDMSLDNEIFSQAEGKRPNTGYLEMTITCGLVTLIFKEIMITRHPPSGKTISKCYWAK